MSHKFVLCQQNCDCVFHCMSRKINIALLLAKYYRLRFHSSPLIINPLTSLVKKTADDLQRTVKHFQRYQKSILSTQENL